MITNETKKKIVYSKSRFIEMRFSVLCHATHRFAYTHPHENIWYTNNLSLAIWLNEVLQFSSFFFILIARVSITIVQQLSKKIRWRWIFYDMIVLLSAYCSVSHLWMNKIRIKKNYSIFAIHIVSIVCVYSVCMAVCECVSFSIGKCTRMEQIFVCNEKDYAF